MPTAQQKIVRVSYSHNALGDLVGGSAVETHVNIIGVLNAIDWSQVEDAVNDQLPEGFYCKVEDA